MTDPRAGDIVHFVHMSGTHLGAHVSAVHGDGVVDLHVFGTPETFPGAQMARYVIYNPGIPRDEGGTTPRTWHVREA